MNMCKRALGFYNTHKIEMAYVSKRNVESNIEKLNRIKRERKYPQKQLV